MANPGNGITGRTWLDRKVPHNNPDFPIDKLPAA